MKTIIAITAAALTFAAPAFADVSVAQKFATYNDSAAERVLGETSQGDAARVQAKVALNNDSAAERIVPTGGTYATRADNASAKAFFAMGNDSAAEIVIR